MSLINVANLTFAYDGSYDNIFENVSFQVDTDWKLGFTGRNGRGKTTFLNLLLGKYEYSGSISASVSFDYFPYEVADKETNSINVVDSICLDYPHWELMRELNLLEVSEDVLYRPFNTLSNGEQTKVLLAALFLKANSFLLIDEPTNHLDMNSRKIVSEFLKSKQGFILVSHDRAFLDNCIDHILSINKTNIEIQKGNFSSWWRNKEMQDSFELAENRKLKQDIKHLTNAARRASDWSDKIEKTKKGGRQASGSKPDKGYIGHKAAKMMTRVKAIEARQQSAIEEKSKLLKNIERAHTLKISYIAQDTDFLRGYLTDFADVVGINESLFKTILRKLDFSRLQFEKDILDFSGGQKKKVLIAKSLCEQAHLYIWDEPLNYIDVLSRIQIEELLLEYQPTILFVEHDRVFSENIATKFVNI
jgi:lincosamide and streptogramin A transport system ATP-binding/permease protein